MMKIKSIEETHPNVSKIEIRLYQGDFWSKRDVIELIQKHTVDKKEIIDFLVELNVEIYNLNNIDEISKIIEEKIKELKEK